MFFHGSSSDATENRLHICSAVNGDRNFTLNSAPVPRGEWTAVEITQLKQGDSYRYTVKVRGVTVGSVINRDAREFYNVDVYAADNWYNAAQGSMRNLVIDPNAEGTLLYGFDLSLELLSKVPKMSLKVAIKLLMFMTILGSNSKKTGKIDKSCYLFPL